MIDDMKDQNWLKQVITISAYTTIGRLDKLTAALHKALDFGVTVNEIKAVFIHLYSYAGSPLINFTALDHVELISPRPLLLIAGSIADSYYFSERAYNLAKEPKELYKIDGATHIDLYWKPDYVTPIVEKLSDFYGKNL